MSHITHEGVILHRNESRHRRGKSTTNQSADGTIVFCTCRIQSCHSFDTIHLQLNWIRSAPEGAVLNKDLRFKSKGTWYKLKFAGKCSLEPSCFFYREQACIAAMCDVTHSCVTWLIYMWYDSFMCGVTHSYVIWLIHVWRDSFICDMTCACGIPTSHGCNTHCNTLCNTYCNTHSYVIWLVRVWHNSIICDMTPS